ncbi:hypothetical protein Pse7429DRAFT_3785 [Pseudanabaena biceps PCC 7429]|uniref:Uncharacterized protein n=1 Tax=Pseudanabaena biceps PCC 7429 TaxID=927668 RepID=L8MU78_9CYAN|nr:hypothetical protein Pse7429DRAFT_3785 [Pseudanabaena biceps PCC 7429]
MLRQNQTLKEMGDALHRSSLLGFTAIIDQTNHKEIFESVALQRFQKPLWFGFERKALYVLVQLVTAISKR